MKWLLLFLPALVSIQLPAQVLRLDNKDHLAQVPSVIHRGDSISFDSTSLEIWNKQNKQVAGKLIADNIDATLDVLADTSNTGFYQVIWNSSTLASMSNDLAVIAQKLRQKDYHRSLQTTSSFYQMDTLLDNLLAAGKKYYVLEYDLSNNGYLQVNVRKKILFNTFLIQYYNITISLKENKPLASLNTRTYQQISIRAQSQMKDLQTLLDPAGGLADQNCYGEALYDVAGDFNDYISTDEITTILKVPFMQQWIWRNNGSIRINPLDFTTDDLLLSRQEPDKEKATLFNAYLDSLVKRYIRNDTTGNLNRFRELLSNMHKGNELFIKGISPVQARAINDSILHSITTNMFTANTIRIPFFDKSSSSRYLQYSSADPSKDPRPSHQEPLTLDDRIFVTIHNIKKNQTAKLIRSRQAKIDDVSPFMQGLDSGLDQFGKILLLFSPMLNINSITSSIQALNKVRQNPAGPFFTPKPSPQFDHPDSLLEDVVTVSFRSHKNRKLTRATFETGLRDILKTLKTSPEEADSCLDLDYYTGMDDLGFDESLFRQAIAMNEAALRNFFTKARSDKEVTALQHHIITAYLRLVNRQKVIPVLLNTLRLDSLQLAFMLQAFSSYTLPPRSLEETEEESGPDLRSEIKVTDYMDDPSSVVYGVIAQTKTDSATLGSFTYKTGKRYFFQVGAGLAYTLSPFTINDVKSDSGKIRVSSSEQKFQFIVSAHFYPFHHGIFLQDRNFFGKGKNACSRINFMIALSIPKPLDNFYFGAGYDIGPAVKLNAGLHLYKYRKYEVQNNEIVNSLTVYKAALPFISLNIEPSGILKAIGIIK